MKKIGLIGAMDEEVAIIKEEMTNTNEVTKAGMTFVEGDFYGIKTVAVVSGIGKVNMAVCTQILCDDFHVTMVINTGVDNHGYMKIITENLGADCHINLANATYNGNGFDSVKISFHKSHACFCHFVCICHFFFYDSHFFIHGSD